MSKILNALVVAGSVVASAHAAVAPEAPQGTPASVTIAGSLQSEAGCAGDWDPACATTHLTYDAVDLVWQGTFSLPAGNYEYLAAIDDAWTERYGQHATPSGTNIPFSLPSGGSVRFYYSDATHWATDDAAAVIAVAAGSFQSELGCLSDWDATCLRSWLQDIDGDGIYRMTVRGLPEGNYEFKVAIDESWSENYGAGGEPGGANIAFTVTPASQVDFFYDAATHVPSFTTALFADDFELRNVAAWSAAVP